MKKILEAIKKATKATTMKIEYDSARELFVFTTSSQLSNRASFKQSTIHLTHEFSSDENHLVGVILLKEIKSVQ
jgi:hypothetical protein